MSIQSLPERDDTTAPVETSKPVIPASGGVRPDLPPVSVAGAFLPDPAIALHHQIKEDMFLHLRSGRWPPGFELPTEEALCRHYGVSRGTLRRAISDLVSEGYIERKRGRGSFVCHPKLESGITGSYTRFRVLGPPLDPGGQVLGCESIGAPDDVATMLGLAPGDPIWRLERVRYTQGRPVSLQTSFIPGPLCPDLDRQELATRHLIDVMREAYDVHLVRAVEYVDPVVADAYTARALSVRARTPLFQIERITYALNDRVAEYRRALLRGDAYRYRIDLR